MYMLVLVTCRLWLLLLRWQRDRLSEIRRRDGRIEGGEEVGRRHKNLYTGGQRELPSSPTAQFYPPTSMRGRDDVRGDRERRRGGDDGLSEVRLREGRRDSDERGDGTDEVIDVERRCILNELSMDDVCVVMKFEDRIASLLSSMSHRKHRREMYLRERVEGGGRLDERERELESERESEGHRPTELVELQITLVGVNSMIREFELLSNNPELLRSSHRYNNNRDEPYHSQQFTRLCRARLTVVVSVLLAHLKPLLCYITLSIYLSSPSSSTASAPSGGNRGVREDTDELSYGWRGGAGGSSSGLSPLEPVVLFAGIDETVFRFTLGVMEACVSLLFLLMSIVLPPALSRATHSVIQENQQRMKKSGNRGGFGGKESVTTRPDHSQYVGNLSHGGWGRGGGVERIDPTVLHEARRAVLSLHPSLPHLSRYLFRLTLCLKTLPHRVIRLPPSPHYSSIASPPPPHLPHEYPYYGEDGGNSLDVLQHDYFVGDAHHLQGTVKLSTSALRGGDDRLAKRQGCERDVSMARLEVLGERLATFMEVMMTI